MGSAKPGTKLREENVGSNSQQESLLLYEAIATSIKKTTSKAGRNEPVCQVSRTNVSRLYLCISNAPLFGT